MPIVKSRVLVVSVVAISVFAASSMVRAERADDAFPFRKRNFRTERNTGAGGNSFFIFRGFGLGQDGSTQRRQVTTIAREQPTQVYTYRPEPLVALSEPKLQQPQKPGPLFTANGGQIVKAALLTPGPLDDTLAQTVFTSLKTGASAVRVTRKQKKAIVKFYKERNFSPVWTDMDGLTVKGAELLAILSRAEEEGLEAIHYLPPLMSSFTDSLEEVESDLRLLSRLEIDLTAMALRYGMDASGGRIIPNRLSGYHDLNPPTVAPHKILARLAASEAPSAYLSSLHPQTAAYKALKAELARFQRTDTQTVLVPIPTGGTIRPGQSDERIAIIRNRLIKGGYLQETASRDDGYGALYDEELEQAVRAFQRDRKLKPDGIIGARTIASFNGIRQLNKRRAIILNMERLRWYAHKFPANYVIANQAAFELQVIRNHRQVWKTKIIVGKPKFQTSVFVDQMEMVVFNPYWGVPQSIIRNEMLPKLINNPGYLDRLGYEVYNGRGQRISSSRVSWWNYGSGGVIPFAVRQPPGNKNALGRIKFLFPNKHAIYMHDTPSKHLFKRRSRAYSHGCVRVYKPRIFAQKILGWSPDQIEQKINSGVNEKYVLPRKIPVYLTYFTAWPDSSGKIRYFSDVYGRDKRLELAFGSTRVALR